MKFTPQLLRRTNLILCYNTEIHEMEEIYLICQIVHTFKNVTIDNYYLYDKTFYKPYLVNS